LVFFEEGVLRGAAGQEGEEGEGVAHGSEINYRLRITDYELRITDDGLRICGSACLLAPILSI
jgi:hypothetical protein